MRKISMRMANRHRKGFTLVELVVSILIIAILAAAVFLGGATVIKQSRESKVKTDLRNMASYVQDMLYENPELQYNSGDYKVSESYTFNTANSKFTWYPSGGTFAAGTKTTTVSTTAATGAPADALTVNEMKVLDLLNKDYLTADFKLDGSTVDAWGNPYCYSFCMSPSGATGDPASCIIVINSLGANSLDESSDNSANTTPVAKANVDGLGGATIKSASDVAPAGTNDDYGVVIVMIDGAVSTAYYGFN